MNKQKNLFIFLLIIFVSTFVYAVINFFIFNNNNQIVYAIILLLAINIVYNWLVNKGFNKRKKLLINKSEILKIDFQKIEGIEKVKTFIFSKKDIISKGEYELINIEHRSTVKEKTIIEIAFKLAKLWESTYEESLKKELKSELNDNKYIIKQKSKDGIFVTDKTGRQFLLGNYSYVNSIVDKDDGSTLFLIRNKILIAKFKFKEILNDSGIESVKRLSKLANIVYIDSENENTDNKLSIFDKAYTGLNIEEQKKIIKELTNKAKTLLFTTNKDLLKIASLDFFVSEYNSNTECANISFDDLTNINKLILISKKVHDELNYALSIYTALNISFIIYLFLDTALR